MFSFPTIQSPGHRHGVYMLPISKSKGRAVLRAAAAAEEEKCVGEGGNFITACHTQIAHRFFSLPYTYGKENLARDQNRTSEDLILVNKGWKNTTRFLEVIRHSNCSLSYIFKITAL